MLHACLVREIGYYRHVLSASAQASNQVKYLAAKKKTTNPRRLRSKALAKKTVKSKHTGTLAARREYNQKINQELLRETIASASHHTKIVKMMAELYEINSEVRMLHMLDKEDQAAYMVRIGTIKTIMDAQFKLLNKYLPDLRTLEFREGDEGNPLATAAAVWAAALNKGDSNA